MQLGEIELVIKDQIFSEVMNELQSRSSLSKIELSVVRCCSSTQDTYQEVARCFELNGFGGMNFSPNICVFLTYVLGQL